MAGDEVDVNPTPSSSPSPAADTSTSAAATPTAGATAGAPAAAGGAAPTSAAPATSPTPNYPPTPSGTPVDPHVSVGRKMLNGILGALGGTKDVEYSRDPQTGKLVATAVKSGPGQQWKRIIAGALTGAAAGASTPAGPGQIGRAAGRGFGAGQQMVERKDQQNYDRAKDSADMEDKATVRKAQVALYNMDLAKSSWELTRSQTEFQAGVEQNSANMLNLLHSDPSNEDMGTYKSFAEFLETHGGNGKQLAQMNTNAELRVIPNIGTDGKMQGVHIVKVNPAWNAQKNTAPVQIDMGPTVGKDGSGQSNMQTIPANSMTNGEIATLQQASSKRWLDYHKDKDENQRATEKNKSEEKIGAGHDAATRFAATAKEQAATINANRPTSSTRTMMETAPKVIELANRIEAQIDAISGDLGPGQGRWNDLWAGKIGASEPKFYGLATNDKLLSSLLMRMHMGARGGVQIMQTFRQMLDEGKQSPENLKAALEQIKTYADDVKNGGGGGNTGGTPQTHVFSKQAWQAANPKGDINAAVAAAQQQGFQVTN